MKIEIIFGGKSVNFSPDVLHRSLVITSVALTGQKKFTTANPRAALEDELAAGLVSAAPTGQTRRPLLKKQRGGIESLMRTPSREGAVREHLPNVKKLSSCVY